MPPVFPTPPPLYATLPPRPAGAPPVETIIGAGSIRFASPAPMIVEAWSGGNNTPLATGALPWSLAIQSEAGGSPGPFIGITVRTSVRVCIFGSSVTVAGYNLASSDNPVYVRAFQVPSMVQTANVSEQGFALPGAGLSTTIAVPPMARRFRWDVPESEKASVYVQLQSGASGTPTVARYAWSEQPSDGIPVGGALTITLHNGDSLKSGRADFFLEV